MIEALKAEGIVVALKRELGPFQITRPLSLTGIRHDTLKKETWQIPRWSHRKHQGERILFWNTFALFSVCICFMCHSVVGFSRYPNGSLQRSPKMWWKWGLIVLCTFAIETYIIWHSLMHKFTYRKYRRKLLECVKPGFRLVWQNWPNNLLFYMAGREVQYMCIFWLMYHQKILGSVLSKHMSDPFCYCSLVDTLVLVIKENYTFLLTGNVNSINNKRQNRNSWSEFNYAKSDALLT